MHGMSREINRIIGRFKRKSIVEIIRLKDGFKDRFERVIKSGRGRGEDEIVF